jgi:hypothetical protein
MRKFLSTISQEIQKSNVIPNNYTKVRVMLEKYRNNSATISETLCEINFAAYQKTIDLVILMYGEILRFKT